MRRHHDILAAHFTPHQRRREVNGVQRPQRCRERLRCTVQYGHARFDGFHLLGETVNRFATLSQRFVRDVGLESKPVQRTEAFDFNQGACHPEFNGLPLLEFSTLAEDDAFTQWLKDTPPSERGPK